MKKLKKILSGLWWKFRRRNAKHLWSSADTLRYGRIVTVKAWHNRLIIICENSIWELVDEGMGIEARLLSC